MHQMRVHNYNSHVQHRLLSIWLNISMAVHIHRRRQSMTTMREYNSIVFAVHGSLIMAYKSIDFHARKWVSLFDNHEISISFQHQWMHEEMMMTVIVRNAIPAVYRYRIRIRMIRLWHNRHSIIVNRVDVDIYWRYVRLMRTIQLCIEMVRLYRVYIEKWCNSTVHRVLHHRLLSIFMQRMESKLSQVIVSLIVVCVNLFYLRCFG